jgi:prepilin-type processing-associated H-X9-DG protein
MFAIMDCQEEWPYPVPGPWISPGLYYAGKGWTGWDQVCGEYSGIDPETLDSPGHWVYGPIQHGKDLNVVFCDAHVAATPRTNIWNLPLSARHWNVDNQPHEEAW